MLLLKIPLLLHKIHNIRFVDGIHPSRHTGLVSFIHDYESEKHGTCFSLKKNVLNSKRDYTFFVRKKISA